MKQVAQSTPARSSKPPPKENITLIDPIPEENEEPETEEIPNPTQRNPDKVDINPTQSADYTTTIGPPMSIENAWKLPKWNNSRTQYPGKKYVIAFSQCKHFSPYGN